MAKRRGKRGRPGRKVSGREAIRRQGYRLLRRSVPKSRIASLLGVQRGTVWHWEQRMERLGPRSWSDRKIPGGPRRLSERQRKRLRELLLEGALAHGYVTELWTLKRVADVIAKEFGVHLARGFSFPLNFKRATQPSLGMPPRNPRAVRTVVLPHRPDEGLLRALHDVSSAVNHLLPDWRAHPEESRFEATKRTYPWVRAHYGHLASSWAVTIANETSATLSAWDKLLRRARRHDPAKFARLKDLLPRRRNLKASLHRCLYRLHGKVLDITLSPERHIRIDLSGTRHPLFWRYLKESGGDFGLAVTDRKLVFNFRVAGEQRVRPESVGVDLNMPSADFATSDGRIGWVDLKEISRIQGAMARKRRSVQRRIPTDLRAQRKVLRRNLGRERNRVRPLLHHAANQLLREVGDRTIIFEDLSQTTEQILKEKRQGHPDQRRALSAWTHGQIQRIVSYKARSAVVRVNARGTSSTCPRCGGSMTHPTWRRSDCAHCQGSWHRDRGAAIVILDRGRDSLRGAALPPSARNALLDAAAWRLGLATGSGPSDERVKGDDANLGSV